MTTTASRHIPKLLLTCAFGIAVTGVAPAARQPSVGALPEHPAVCAQGVKLYYARSEVPTPYDSLEMPPSSSGPVRVTNDEEAQAAELEMRKRAGSVGATGLVITEMREEDGGQVRLHRSLLPVFVASDSARAQGECKKS